MGKPPDLELVCFSNETVEGLYTTQEWIVDIRLSSGGNPEPDITQILLGRTGNT
jgi:hypothetical protein